LIGGIANEENIMLLRGDQRQAVCLHEERCYGMLKQRAEMPLLQSEGFEEVLWCWVVCGE
jgi:hypothetical protein